MTCHENLQRQMLNVSLICNLCQILDNDDKKILVFPVASSLRAFFVNLKKLASTTGVSDAARKEVHWKLEAAVPLPCV